MRRKSIIFAIVLGGCLLMADCAKEPKKTEGQGTEVDSTMADVLVCDSVESDAVAEVSDMNTLLGDWSEPSGDQHNLSLKSDGTFEYQDFEKTKGGDMIDVMRQGTYTIDGDSVRLKGNDGWKLSLHYTAAKNTLDEAHLTAGNKIDFVRE